MWPNFTVPLEGHIRQVWLYLNNFCIGAVISVVFLILNFGDIIYILSLTKSSILLHAYDRRINFEFVYSERTKTNML
jgi:hypothetical protein